jgi:hypothetical protein
VRDLSSAGRLAAWGTAVLAGEVSPDVAADVVSGPTDATHRVVGLPGEQDAVTLPYALARLRSLGVTGLRLVLPRPGDAAGLPGPAAFNETAVECGEAVVSVGSAHLGLLPAGRSLWQAHRVEDDPRTPLQLRDADRDLTRATRGAAAVLARLDVARWDPDAAALLGERARSHAALLPGSAPAEAHQVLDRALRLAAVLELARRSDGAAVSSGEMRARTQVPRDLDAVTRRAVEAACSPDPS